MQPVIQRILMVILPELILVYRTFITTVNWFHFVFFGT